MALRRRWNVSFREKSIINNKRRYMFIYIFFLNAVYAVVAAATATRKVLGNRAVLLYKQHP